MPNKLVNVQCKYFFLKLTICNITFKNWSTATEYGQWDRWASFGVSTYYIITTEVDYQSRDKK